MDRIKVLVLSSVVPNALGSGGELVLHRHLNLNPGIQSEVLHWDGFPFRLKLIGKLKQLGFRFVSRSWECLFPVFPSRKLVHEFIQRFRPDVVLTVAHGWWHIQARRVAGECNLPLVSCFQDWWPDFPDVPVIFRSGVEREFRRTCKASAVAICVSDGMRREFGEPPNALVIYPVPSLRASEGWRPDFKLPLRVVYFGNLYEYGPIIEGALRALDGSDQVRLEVFGASPHWAAGAEDYFRSRGLYHKFIPSDQLAESLGGFQAVLVVMSFTPALRRRMATSLPSKLIDAMQLNLPVIVWGPEYCSAVKWSLGGERALCVTDPNPSALRKALEKLATSAAEQERLAAASRDAARMEFNPERIQAQFTDVLRQAIQISPVQNRHMS
jgi:glycosyltransferase involved in cell wall biosynthesis